MHIYVYIYTYIERERKRERERERQRERQWRSAPRSRFSRLKATSCPPQVHAPNFEFMAKIRFGITAKSRFGIVANSRFLLQSGGGTIHSIALELQPLLQIQQGISSWEKRRWLSAQSFRCSKPHTVEYDPFIKSQLAPRHSVQGLM